MPKSDTLFDQRAPDLQSDQIHLTHLGIDLVSDRYINWMNDYEVVKLIFDG